MIWLNPVSDFWLNTQAKPKHDMTRMTRLAGSKHLNTGKSRVSVKACYTPTDSSRTFTGRHASNMLKWFNRKIWLYAVLFNLLIKMHTKGSQASQRFAQCMVSQDQAYRKDLWAPPCGSNCNYFISDKRYEWFCFKFYIQTFFSSAGVINWSLINPEQTLHHRLVRQTHHSHVYVSLHLQKLTLNVKNSFVAFKFKGQERKNLNMLRKACLLIFIKLNHVKGQQHKTNT